MRIGFGELLVVGFAAFAIWEIYDSNKASVPDKQTIVGRGEGFAYTDATGRQLHGQTHCDDHQIAVITIYPGSPEGIRSIQSDCSPHRDIHHGVIFAPCEDGRMPEIHDVTFGSWDINCRFNRHPATQQPTGDNETVV
jgi:hypothetical protein